jgi:3-dehydroquinate dehydratase-2
MDKKKILIINGPNLNLLGQRETTIYGVTDWESFYSYLQKQFPMLDLSYFQSNYEGALIDKIQQARQVAGLIINAGALTHYSYALYDALRNFNAPVIEVHISNIHNREKFRRRSLISPVCKGVISGLGLNSYQLALYFFSLE